MAAKTFTPGDRVKIIDYPDTRVNGMIGTIREKSIHIDRYHVDTDDPLPGEMWTFPDEPEHALFVFSNEMEAI